MLWSQQVGGFVVFEWSYRSVLCVIAMQNLIIGDVLASFNGR